MSDANVLSKCSQYIFWVFIREKFSVGAICLIHNISLFFSNQLMHTSLAESLKQQKPSLSQLKSQIGVMFEKESFESICQQYKTTCIRLNHLIKTYFKVPHPSLTYSCTVHRDLRTCIRMIDDLVSSTEFSKFGHHFPLFFLLVRKFERLTGEKISCHNSAGCLNRIEKNELSAYYFYVKNSPINKSKITEKQLTGLLTRLMNGKDFVSNPQCIQCVRFFTRGIETCNLNPAFPLHLMKVTKYTSIISAKDLNLINLQRYFNAICNQGGGTIVIGVHYENNAAWPQGIQFHTLKSIEDKEKAIRCSLQKITPPCQFSIQRILTNETHEKTAPTDNKTVQLCFRVNVMPYRLSALSYIEHKLKGEIQSTFQVFQMTDKFSFRKLENTVSQNILTSNIYNQMIKHYYKNQGKIYLNSHQYIDCFKPQIQKNNMVLEHVLDFQQNKVNKEKGKYSFNTTEEEDKEELTVAKETCPKLMKQIKLKYKNTSLFLLSSKKHKDQVYSFVSKLNEAKYSYELTQPYEDQLGNIINRPVWLISHEISIKVLKNILADLLIKERLKYNGILIVPVEKCLQIKAAKLSAERQEKFLQIYRMVFADLYEIEEIEQDGYKNIFMKFDDKKRSTYAYMILESMGLRPYFISENDNGSFKIYKKYT